MKRFGQVVDHDEGLAPKWIARPCGSTGQNEHMRTRRTLDGLEVLYAPSAVCIWSAVARGTDEKCGRVKLEGGGRFIGSFAGCAPKTLGLARQATANNYSIMEACPKVLTALIQMTLSIVVINGLLLHSGVTTY